ncbi:MAG: InlB B-repeat-containing protein [Candidatus Eiseniibacteriota bacterium]
MVWYVLTVVGGPGGSVTPRSTFRPSGATVVVRATAFAGNSFAGWVGTGPGSYTGPNRAATITMGGHITQTATFGSTLTMNAGPGGTVSPATGTHAIGSQVTIEAFPGAGNVFIGWTGVGSGSYTGTNNPATVIVNGPITQTAAFQLAVPVTVTTSPPGLRIGVDGADYVSPYTFAWLAGTTHDVDVDSLVVGSGDRRRFAAWNDGIVTPTRSVVTPPAAATFTAEYSQEYMLTFLDPPEGASSPGDGWFAAGDSVSITAVPVPGFAFEEWTGSGNGSYTGTANPVTVTMNGPITQTPSFRPLGYELSISASATDPLVNTGSPTGGVRSVYLWMVCSVAGVAALEADVTGDLPVLGFAPANGVVNVGTSTALLLAIPGCAVTGPLLLGSIVVDDVGGTLCLGPSAASGVLGAVDCQTFTTVTPLVTGFSSSGQAPCVAPGVDCSGQALLPVTVMTSPTGLRIGVDGVDYVSPHTFSWIAGSSHSLSVDSLVVGSPGDRQRLAQWSDGHLSAARTIFALTSSYVAQYTREYLLDFQDPPEGTSLPGDGWYGTAVSVQITAVPDAGFGFDHWTGTGNGSFSGTENPATVTMNGPITQIPHFLQSSYLLTMSAGAGGTVTPASGSHLSGTVVQIQALPDSGFKFVGWVGTGTGSYTGTNNPATVTMGGPITQTAAFVVDGYQLTMFAGLGGTVTPATGLQATGAMVTIQAIPDPGYAFVNWTGVGGGSYSGTSNPATVTMNGPITQTATFIAGGFLLTTSAGPGGTVLPASGPQMPWTTVPIQALPDSGYAFLTWTGVGNGSYSGPSNPAIVTMNGPITQTATFAQGYTLTMAADPGGSVTPPAGLHSFAANTPVVIQALATSGEAFIGWTGTGPGSYTGIDNPAIALVNGDITQTAHFAAQVPVPLTMIAGPGGTVTPASGTYNVGTLLTIRATPNTGWAFSDWVGTGSGSYTGPSPSASIRIAGPIAQTANFVVPTTWLVTMVATGGGTVTPATGSYPGGSVLQVDAIPNPGYAFSSWAGYGPGSYTGSANPATITVNGNIVQTARFQVSVPITLTTSPPSLRINVDGVDYVAPQTFGWAGGSLHAVNVDSLVVGVDERHRFTSWSDGHSAPGRQIATPGTATTFSAAYVHEYLLAFQDPPGGTSQPGDGYKSAGSAVPITGVPSPGFAFTAWTGTGSGSYTGTANPATVTMNGPIVQSPAFRPLGYEISISASATDPSINTAAPTGAARTLHLWLTCSDTGISALEADVTGDLPVLAFAPAAGVLNAGTAQNLLLAIAGCESTGAMLLGSLVVTDTGGSVCLGPSAAHGVLAAVDCTTFGPSSPQVTGFSSSGAAPCAVAGNACLVPAPSVARVGAQGESIQSLTPPVLLPLANAFLGARPNPFAGQTDLHFAVASAARVRFSIYDVTGRLVRRLADEDMAAGEHLRSWDGRGENGSHAAGGVYFVRLQIGSFRQTERIVLMRSGD